MNSRFFRGSLFMAASAVIFLCAPIHTSAAEQGYGRSIAGTYPVTVPLYDATILPQLDPGTDGQNRLIFTTPHALDDRRRVTGTVGTRQGFVWDPIEGGRLLQPQFSSFADQAFGDGVNAAGDIVGSYLPVGAGFGDTRAFQLSSTGAFTPLPSLGPNLVAGATDINDWGLIVGVGETEDVPGPFGGPTSAVYWKDGQIFGIGGLGGFVSRAGAVNNLGVVVGSANAAEVQALRPFRWTRLRGIEALPQLVEGYAATPEDINDLGIIVGRADPADFASEAVFWDVHGRIHVLPRLYDPPNSGVLGINNHNFMVGREFKPGFGPEARLWIGATVLNLRDLVPELPPGYELREAVDINDHGDIVVSASTVVDGKTQFVTVLLSPKPHSRPSDHLEDPSGN